MKFFDVWSVNASNLEGEFDTQEAAMARAGSLLADGWRADDLSLGWGDTDDEDTGGTVATGPALAALLRLR
jgi:hypothetical protein